MKPRAVVSMPGFLTRSVAPVLEPQDRRPELTSLPDMIERELSAQTDAYAALARLDPPARARVLRWPSEVLEHDPS